MRAIRLVPVTLGVASALLLTSPLAAQDARTLLRQGVQAFNDFDTQRALPLLRRGVNPGAGPQDSLWAIGVQYIAQILFDEGQTGPATAWARWGMRLAPTMRIDSVNLVSDVVDALAAGRAAAAPTSGDAATTTAFSWPAGDPGTGPGRVDVTPSTIGVPINVLVVGRGVVVSGQGLSLPAGSYQIQASAQGFQSVEVTREVIPGVTTVLSFLLPSAPVLAAGDLPDATRDAVLGRIASLTVNRFGDAPACGAAALVGRDGLMITTYGAVRGADRADVNLGNRRLTDVRVAAYDVQADLAILKTSTVQADSLPLAAAIEDGQFAWTTAFANCGAPAERRLRITSWQNRPNGALALSDSVANVVAGSPLFDQQGALVGLATGGRAALPAPRAAALLDRARQNVAAGRLQTLAAVGTAENHSFGSVAITSTLRNAVGRVTPLEAWHWPELARTAFVPYTFAGPQGRYRFELTVNGQVQRTVEFTLTAGSADQLAVNPEQVAQQPDPGIEPEDGGGGGFPWIIAVLGGGGAAGLLLALMGGGGGPGPGDDGCTSCIILRIPDRD